MLERGCSCPTERTTSLRAPWETLNTREEHEARALFWYEGFSEWNDDYMTRARRKMEEDKKRKMEEEQRK